MRDREGWRPSKFVRRRGRLMASRDLREMSCCSRLIGDLTAGWYDEVLPRHAHGRLLDLGCGNVPLYEAYRDFCSEVTCVDWGNSPHACKHLDHAIDITGPLPFADRTFDCVLLSDVLEHIPTPDFTCREVARVLTKGGKFIMNVPFFYWLHEQPHDYHRYTEFALARLMQISGMQIDQLDRLGGAVEILADVFAKTITHVPVLGMPMAICAQGVAAFFGRTRVGRKARAVTAFSLPLAYGLVAVRTA